MQISNHSVSKPRDEQVFMFSITSDSVTRATATIYAKDLDIAWRRIHCLFPGLDLGDIEVQQADL